MTTGTTAPPVAPTTPAAPLLASYGRLREVFPALRVHHRAPRAGQGWIRTADLLRHRPTLRALIAVDAHQGLARYGTPLRPDVAAGFCLHRYCWPVSLLFTLPWFLERRVPRIPAEAVALRRRSNELSFRYEEFSCLPDDPAAGLPAARVVPDEAALRERLLAALAEHLAPVLTAFRPELRRGPHTLRAMATDDVIEALWYAGSLLGAEDRAAEELTELFGQASSEFFTPGGTGFRRTERPAAPPVRSRTRLSCCLYYTVRAEDACAGCPRRK
ncbi:Iron-sulfur protein [Kitasatospora sp. MMS16-BH015]|uniref:(2Fe-2S)-binding protein n=1 Tax=Kitasatospora sp. MMS16-BH015 TaxID=2018025 RepID=UPI000CA3833F|nr:(2Fe-2S)-binding protein [Kitasatospora sp. MMS16-BH015]AUG76505.1 Iron-sulfur protein [Kitasatospora sp. MMS16-BH015]